MGGSPPRPWALPTEALSPCPLGMSPRPLSHLGCPGVLGRGGGGSSKEGAARPLSPQPLGPNRVPILLRLLWVRQWGQGLVLLPQLKIAALALWKAPGAGEEGAGLLSCGREEAAQAGNAPVPRGPPSKGSGQRAQPPGKSQAVPLELHRTGVSWIPRVGHPPAVTSSGPGVVSCHGHQEGRTGVVLSCSVVVCTW